MLFKLQILFKQANKKIIDCQIISVMSSKVFMCMICHSTFHLESEIRKHLDQDHDLRHPAEVSSLEIEKITKDKNDAKESPTTR